MQGVQGARPVEFAHVAPRVRRNVEEVGKREADYSDQISKLKLEIDVVNEKNQNMEANLEFERKLRLQHGQKGA